MLEQHNEVQTNVIDKKMASVKDKETEGLSENHVFETPVKRVLGINDVALWEKSEAYQVRNVTFIQSSPNFIGFNFFSFPYPKMIFRC